MNLVETFNMEWFIKNLDVVKWPYELRGIYNRHKDLVLKNEHLFSNLFDRAQLLLSDSTDALDRSTLENFIFDLEADKYLYTKYPTYKKPKPKTPSHQAFIDQLPPKEISVQTGRGFLDLAKKYLVPSDAVRIEILDPTCNNLAREAEYEIFRQVFIASSSNKEAAKLLGLAERTIRTHLSDILKKGKKHENEH